MENYLVKVHRINWLDKENPEGEVLFEINNKEYWAFCHPCKFSEGENAYASLRFLEGEVNDDDFWNKNVNNRKELIPSEENQFGYSCYGQIKKIHPVEVDCGDFSLPFGDWINDESVIDSYVSFSIARLDIIKVEE